MTVFCSSDGRIGYRSRETVAGRESDLVHDFIFNGLDGRGYSFRSRQMAVFVEPCIDSGFPDVVIAEFDSGFYDAWTDARDGLTCRELKLLAMLHSIEEDDSSSSQIHLQMESRSLAKSAELLCAANLIRRDCSARRWLPLPLKETFGIKRLIAVEAKMSNSQKVLEQASLNRWFASESYALTPSRPEDPFLARARRVGIGMVFGMPRDGYRRCLKAKQSALPTSYVSWQFNEWIGRRLHSERGSK